MSYTPPNEMLDASWLGAEAYVTPQGVAHGSWAPGRIIPAAFDSTAFGCAFVTKQQFVVGQAWDSVLYGAPLVTLNYEFIPRWVNADASWLGATTYLSASGTRHAQWSRGAFATAQAVFDAGVGDCGALGDPALRMDQRLWATGWDALWVQPPAIWSVLNASWVGAPSYTPERENLGGSWAVGTFSVTLTAKGFDAHRPGQPTIYNRNQHLTGIGGIPSQLVFGGDYPPGTPDENRSETVIWNRNQFLTLFGIDSQAFGTALLGGGVRWLITQQIAPPAMQKPWLSFSPRWIEAGDLKAPGVSVPLVGGTRYLEPAGYEATLWGERIIPESQTIYPEGQVLTLWGETKPWNYTTWVAPQAIKWQAEGARFGTQHVWNWQRYLTQYEDVQFQDSFGLWTEIENRNKVISHHSTAPGFLPMPKIDNAARPLLPAPIAAPSTPDHYKAGMISHGVRSYQIEGIEPPLLSRWLTVVNDAKVVAPGGYVASLFGDNIPANTRRYFPYITGGDQQIIGTPMVADRIREVTFESRYGIAPPVPTGPEVKLHTRYIEHSALDALRYGTPFLEIHWTKFFPRWTHIELFGETRVKNLTPELGAMGRDSQEFGDTFVRLQWRPVAPAETFTQRFGAHRISDRRRVVLPQAVYPVKQGDKHKVERTGAYIPETQWLVQYAAHGYNSALRPIPEDHGLGEPALNLQSAYPAGFDALKLGDPRLTANSIRPKPGYVNYLAFGEHMVSRRNRVIDLDEKGFETTDEVYKYGKPRLSPHTIWAVVEATSQARDNHGNPNLYYVDQDPITGWFTKGVGRPAVTLREQYVRLSGDSFVAVGTPALELKDRRVTVSGMPLMKMGWNTVRGNLHYIRHRHKVPGVDDPDAPDVEPALFGEHKLTHYWSGPQAIKPLGLFGSIPNPVVDHFHRKVHPGGFEATQMGSSRGGSPYAWQSLNVGPPMPTLPDGFNAELFGDTWVSLKIRDIFVPGSDHFISEYDFKDFALRMRVRLEPTPPPSVRTINARGFNAFDSAASGNVSNWVQYIRPDGNMDNYRKGAPQ